MNATKPKQPHGIPEFADVFAQHSGFAWRVLARLGVPSGDTADACQEVFLVVHRRLPDFDPCRGTLRTWIYGICLRVASTHRRRNPAREETNEELLSNLSAPAQPDTDLETRRAWLRLSSVLQGLDAAKREVFVLYELEALPMSEIAVILSCPLQTAYARLHAARRAVLAAFRREGTP